ncbi:MAG TPA: 50S ribosomal protein L23 [Dehalococcoidia bacterium]|jgi:large subunit ribosomal protein L23|nr:50S ribosomal protein L23 [Dehalococcoidia bacterium]
MPKELHPFAVIKRPLITEKATMLAGANKYAFEVDPRANKAQIKEAVELAFNVRVTAVNTMIVKGKTRRAGRRARTKAPDWKKAIVTVAPTDRIQIFEGV